MWVIYSVSVKKHCMNCNCSFVPPGSLWCPPYWTPSSSRPPRYQRYLVFDSGGLWKQLCASSCSARTSSSRACFKVTPPPAPGLLPELSIRACARERSVGPACSMTKSDRKTGLFRGFSRSAATCSSLFLGFLLRPSLGQKFGSLCLRSVRFSTF